MYKLIFIILNSYLKILKKCLFLHPIITILFYLFILLTVKFNLINYRIMDEL